MVLDLVLAAIGAALAGGVIAQVPAGVVVMRVLAIYTLYAVAVTVLLALARALTRQLPTVRPGQLDEEKAWVLRSWAGDWWYSTALDAGLAVLGGWLAVLGLRAGGEWVLPSLVVASAGAWFLVRVGLGLVGRRSRETLWVTAGEVVHDSSWGRARGACGDVVDVSGRGTRLVIRFNAPVGMAPCPRPWRRGRRPAPPDAILFFCFGTGHEAEDLAGWVRSELGWA